MNYDFAVFAHPSGVGFVLAAPSDVHFRITRTTDKERGEELIVEGRFPHTTTYFDYAVNLLGKTTYKFYTVDGDEEETLRLSMVGVPQPAYSWNPFLDPFLRAAQDPREALVVFYSTRLAQLVREGTISVGNPNHAVFFPVWRGNTFKSPEAPLIGLEYSDGSGASGSMGLGFIEESLVVTGTILAANPEDLDATTRAVRSLVGEVEAFMAMFNVYEVRYGNFQEMMIGAEPTPYGATFSIGCKAINFYREASEETWTLVRPSFVAAVPNSNRALMTQPDNLEQDILQALERDTIATY